MSRINELPIPDWGLVCPHCRSPLDGLPEHRCGKCGQLFNILPILALHRPIPELDVCCPNCGYNLTGLTGSRCPECGIRFSLRAILGDLSETGAVDPLHLADPLDHHRKRREPAFTGSERPLPEFGLTCETCGAGLAGAAEIVGGGAPPLSELQLQVPLEWQESSEPFQTCALRFSRYSRAR